MPKSDRSPTTEQLMRIVSAAAKFARALRNNLRVKDDPDCPANLPGFPDTGECH